MRRPRAPRRGARGCLGVIQGQTHAIQRPATRRVSSFTPKAANFSAKKPPWDGVQIQVVLGARNPDNSGEATFRCGVSLSSDAAGRFALAPWQARLTNQPGGRFFRHQMFSTGPYFGDNPRLSVGVTPLYHYCDASLSPTGLAHSERFRLAAVTLQKFTHVRENVLRKSATGTPPETLFALIFRRLTLV